MSSKQSIIVKRVSKAPPGHHGGAWKIAFADFAMAMMAFFLVMWLMSSATPEQKKAISGYFEDPIGFTQSASPYIIDLGGTPAPAPQRTLSPPDEVRTDSDEPRVSPHPADSPASASSPAADSQARRLTAEQAERLAEQVEQERLALLLQELQNKLVENPELHRFKDQILFDITQDGLRIQIMDSENRPMFALGSAQLQPYFEDILLTLAQTINRVPNKISISGHTDATPYVGRVDFGNWELSAARANAARRTLIAGGYPEQQVARVVGYASSALFDREDPFSPMNRRIDIVVLTRKAQRAIEGEPQGDSAPATPATDTPLPAAPPAAEVTPAAPPAADPRRNAFDAGMRAAPQR